MKKPIRPNYPSTKNRENNLDQKVVLSAISRRIFGDFKMELLDTIDRDLHSRTPLRLGFETPVRKKRTIILGVDSVSTYRTFGAARLILAIQKTGYTSNRILETMTSEDQNTRKTLLEDQTQALIRQATFSVDRCIVAKAIALGDDAVRELFFSLALNSAYKVIGINCVDNGAEIGVLFQIECKEYCLISPQFLAVVNIRRRKVIEIIEAFNGTEWPDQSYSSLSPSQPSCCTCDRGSREAPGEFGTAAVYGSFGGYGVLAVQPDTGCCGSIYTRESRTIELGRHYFKDGCGNRGCRNCNAEFFVELDHPRIAEAIGAAQGCLRVAAVATAVTAILSSGSTTAALVATFESALKACMVAKGIDFAFAISLTVRKRDKSCGGCSWSNCVN